MAVTYYNRKDLVAFGNYLLSDDRKKNIEEAGNDNFNQVTHADIENFLYRQKKK